MHVPTKVRWIPAIILISTAAFASQAGADDILSLAQAEQMAVRNNAALAAAGKRAEAMAAIPAQAGSLPDPMLSLNAMSLPVDTFSNTQEPMTQMQLGISQSFPFPGKLSLRARAADFEARSASWDVAETDVKLIENVRVTWWNIFYLDRALEIVSHNQTLLRQFVRIAEVKYKTGEGLQQDVLLAQVELSKLLDIEISLKGARKIESAQLNALMNRLADTPVTLPATASELLPEVPSEARLQQLAMASRPLLGAEAAKIGAADSRVALAEKDFYPDFNLGGAYGLRNGRESNGAARADLASIMLSFNLPVYTSTKQSKALQQRRAEKAESEFRLADEKLRVAAEVSASLADFRRASEQASLFKTGIIPQSSQTVSSMIAGYQVNKVDFLNLVRSQITLYNYETQYWKALAEAHQAHARLTAAVGKELPHE